MEKCIKLLQDNYENIHLQSVEISEIFLICTLQLQRLIERFFRDSFEMEDNIDKINQLEIDFALYLV